MPGPETEATIAFANATADALGGPAIQPPIVPPRHQRTPLSAIYSVYYNAWIDQEGNLWDKDGNRLPTANGENYAEQPANGQQILGTQATLDAPADGKDDELQVKGEVQIKRPAAPPLHARPVEFMTDEEVAAQQAAKRATLEGDANSVKMFDAGQLAADPILRFFEYGHLPPQLQMYSAPFGGLARFIIALPRNAERTVALRKLLEAKDAAVRAAL